MKSREFMKILLAHSGLTYRKLAAILSEKTEKKYSRDSLYAKVRRGSLKLDEADIIATLLGYNLEPRKHPQ